MRLRSLLKRPAYLVLLTISDLADFFRYLRYASILAFYDSDRKLEALIRKDNHRIEKGLALPEPRPWFGESVLARLCANLARYSRAVSPNSMLLDESAAVVNEYEAAFKAGAVPPASVARSIRTIRDILGTRAPFEAGTVMLEKGRLQNAAAFDFELFAKSRFSVRSFAGTPIPEEVVGRAVRVATKTPSVCNRCAWRVYNVVEPTTLERVLACQNGNSGFGHTCGNVLVVCADLRCFEGGGERNQAYVDGGLFAMSLVYALHGNGVASCFLNWSADYFQDAKLRDVLSIPGNEVIVTLVAIGGYPDALRVAVSPRPPVDEVLVTI